MKNTQPEAFAPAADSAQLCVPRTGLTWRSVVLALLLIPPNVYWVEQMEMMRYSAHPTTVSLFFNVVVTLLQLVARGSTIITELQRLAMRVPEPFQQLDSHEKRKYQRIIFDFSYFEKADGNGDGFLTQDEIMKAMRPPRGDMGPPPPPAADAQ